LASARRRVTDLRSGLRRVRCLGLNRMLAHPVIPKEPSGG